MSVGVVVLCKRPRKFTFVRLLFAAILLNFGSSPPREALLLRSGQIVQMLYSLFEFPCVLNCPRWRDPSATVLSAGVIVGWSAFGLLSSGSHCPFVSSQVGGFRSSPLNTVRSTGIQSTVKYGLLIG